MISDRILAFGPGERLSGVLSGEPHAHGEVLVLLSPSRGADPSEWSDRINALAGGR